MCEPTTLAVASLAMGAVGTFVQMQGQRAQGKAAQSAANYKAAVARNNQIIANRQAEDARKRGKIAAQQKSLEARQLIGRQRAALAGSGQVVDTGSALDITTDTAGIGRLDALTIRSNAEREAMGFEVQGMNFESDAQFNILEGNNARRAANTAAFGTALTGAGKVAGKWYNFNQQGVFDSSSSMGTFGGGYDSYTGGHF